MTDMPTTYETHQTTTTTTAQGPVNIAPRMEYLRTVPGILKIVEIILDLIVFICACIIWWGAALGWIRFVSMSAFLTTLVYFILYFINAVPQIHKSMGNNVSLFQLIAIDVLIFICTWIVYWPGEGWVGFVAVSAFVTTLLNFLLYFLGVMERFYQTIAIRLVILDLITIVCSSVNDWEAAQSYCEFVCIAAFLFTLLLLVLHVLGLIRQFPGPWLLIEFIYYIVFSIFYLIAAIVAASYAKYHSSIAACTFFAFAATAVYAVDTFFQYRAWRSGQAEMSTNVTATTTTTTTTHQVETREQYAGQTY